MSKQSPPIFLDYNDLSEIKHHNEKTQWVSVLHTLTNSEIETEYPSYLDNIVVIKDWKSKVSASNSKIISGDIIDSEIPKHLKHIKHKILIKITKKELVACDNSLKVELLLYRNVLNKLLYRNVCPHIIGYLNDKKFQLPVYNKKDKKVELKNFNYLFLEMSNGVTLRNYSEEKKSEEKKSEEKKYADGDGDTIMNYSEEKKSKEKSKKKYLEMSLNDLIGITFQILYTLAVFKNILLSHNDLHPGNIIIENKYIKYSYKINEQIVTLECNYLVKIFDFDNASIYNENVCRNIKLDYEYDNFHYCKDWNMCNVFTNNDLHLVLTSLVQIIILNKHESLIPIFNNFLKNKVQGGIINVCTVENFRLDSTKSHILKNYKSPFECLRVLCTTNPDIIKDCIKIVSAKGAKATYTYNQRKNCNFYRPKLQIYINENSQNLCDNLYKHVDKFFDNVFSNDIEFLIKNYKYDVYGDPLINFISYCQENDILMTRELAKKLVLPFIYGIPNYIYKILESHEIQMYNNFAENVNGLLPIKILDVFGNSGMTYANE
jgi:hypothetical protein